MVLFKSGLPTEEVLRLFKERTGKYREVGGLLQKLWIHDELSGEVGGIYVFDSKENLAAFQSSDLARGLGDVYRFVAPPTRKVLKVTNVLFQTKSQVV